MIAPRLRLAVFRSWALRQYAEFGAFLEEEPRMPSDEETAIIYKAIKAKRMLGSFVKGTEQVSHTPANGPHADTTPPQLP